MLSDDLGITYRRIPVLALDGQVYMDTTCIAQVLEDTFGGKPGHGPRLFLQAPAVQKRAAGT